MAVSKPVALTGTALAAFITALLAWGKTHNVTPTYDPAKDTTKVFVGKDKLGKRCEAGEKPDMLNPAVCAWVIPDSQGYMKKSVPMNDSMWAARDAMMKVRFDKWFASHSHVDTISLQGVKTDKYTAQAVMDSVYKKEGHYPTVKLVGDTK